MRSVLSIVAVAGLLSAGPAFGADEPSDEKKIVCKSERFVGSNLRQRICKTKGEWDNAKKNAHDALDQREMKPPRPKGSG